MIRCFIGLGSNLDDPETQVHKATRALDADPDIRLQQLSPLYRNPAIGPGQQPDYLNAVAELHTTLPAIDLLQTLQSIEDAQGRIRLERWGPRALDLDLLLYGTETIASAMLTVPHPRLRERAFVLYPLYDIAPDLVLPDGTSLSSLLDCCPDHDLQRL